MIFFTFIFSPDPFDFSGFAHSQCEIVAGSPNEDLEQCFHVHDNSCATFVEENCSYNGTDTGTDISFIVTYFPA